MHFAVVEDNCKCLAKGKLTLLLSQAKNWGSRTRDASGNQFLISAVSKPCSVDWVS